MHSESNGAEMRGDSRLRIGCCCGYLDEEYKELCLHALEKLCRKRPSPLTTGRATTWAAGIVYAIGSANFIFDKSQPIHYTDKELAEPFGVGASTAASKGGEIKKMLRIDRFNAEWILPSLRAADPLFWTLLAHL